VANVYDPEFAYLSTCSKLQLHMARDLSDSLVLDLRPDAYREVLSNGLQSLAANGALAKLAQIGLETATLAGEISKFGESARQWRQTFTLASQDAALDPILARSLNDQSMKVDRAFLLPEGLPNRPQFRHAVLSPAATDSYGSDVFPGIADLLSDYDELDENGQNERKKELAMHLTQLVAVIKRASDLIGDLAVFERV